MLKVHLVKPTTGQVLNLDGELHLTGEKLSYETSFESYEEALMAKDNLLREVVWGVVSILDENTNKEALYSNKEIERQYIAETEKWNNYLSLSWYKKVFIGKPKLKYVKT